MMYQGVPLAMTLRKVLDAMLLKHLHSEHRQQLKLLIGALLVTMGQVRPHHLHMHGHQLHRPMDQYRYHHHKHLGQSRLQQQCTLIA